MQKIIFFLSETALLDVLGIRMESRHGVAGYKPIYRNLVTLSFEKCRHGEWTMALSKRGSIFFTSRYDEADVSNELGIGRGQ